MTRPGKDSTASKNPDQSSQPQSRWWALAFGSQSSHVEVDFQRPAPMLVTELLHACLRNERGGAPDESVLWQWPVTDRLQGLIAIAQVTLTQPLHVDTHCRRCQAALSFELPLVRFAHTSNTHSFQCHTADGKPLRFRLPTGRDQLRWLTQGKTDLHSIARDLVVEPAQVPTEASWLPQLEAALEQADPLTVLELESQCPECQGAVAHPYNLELGLLQRLQGCLARLMRNVHRLAQAYHWSEKAILDLPPQRRDFYLACVAGSNRGGAL